jgi:hypothetical protein
MLLMIYQYNSQKLRCYKALRELIAGKHGQFKEE